MTEIFGYFDAPEQEAPAFDPGLDVPCAYCLKPLSRPMRAISLMKPGDGRSYFYRAHKDCYDHASADEVCDLESSLIDTLPPNDKVSGGGTPSA